MLNTNRDASMTGTTGALCDAGATQATKTPPQGDLASKSQGLTLAAEVMASVQTQARPWNDYAQRIITGNIEFRAAFVEQLTRDVKALNKANTLDDTIDAKLARKRVSSATTQARMMKAIAVGFNAGATLEGLCTHAGCKAGQHGLIGYTIITEYARQFGSSKAGRPADDFWTVVSKFLDRTVPAEDDVHGVALHAKLVKFLNSNKAPAAL